MLALKNKHGAMRFAVFYRNLNLGRPNCPTRAQFEGAFLAAGAHAAASFLTNGTLVFEAGGVRAARSAVAKAGEAMARSCGLKEPAFLRPLSFLAQCVADEPFAAIDRTGVYGCYVTFVSPSARLALLPPASARGDVRVIGHTEGAVWCTAHLRGNSPGSPNALIEKTLEVQATTRAWNTVVRMVGKYGA